MFQTIDGVDVFVVDITEDPKTLIPINSADTPALRLYAEALEEAIQKGEIKEPGKYGISVTDSGRMYSVFRIIE